MHHIYILVLSVVSSNNVISHLQKNYAGQEGALQVVSRTAVESHNYPNEAAFDNDLKILARNWLPKSRLLASCAWSAIPADML